MAAGDDHLVPIEDAKRFHDELEVEDKTLKIYEGFYHEIFNEISKEKPLQDLSDWLEARI